VRFDVEVQPREPGQAARPPGGVERDDAGDARGRARRIGDPGRILQHHGLDREAEAPGRSVQELPEAPGVLRGVDEEPRPVLDAQVEALRDRGEAGELSILLRGRPPVGAVDPDRRVRRGRRRPRPRGGGDRRAPEEQADDGQGRAERPVDGLHG
jgi:hypothetical protein